MTSIDDIDLTADDFVLPQLDFDFDNPSRLLQQPSNNNNIAATMTTGHPTSEIQIDEEVVIKNKRKPQVKLFDR